LQAKLTQLEKVRDLSKIMTRIITRLLGGKKAVFSIPKNVNGSMAFYQEPHLKRKVQACY